MQVASVHGWARTISDEHPMPVTSSASEDLGGYFQCDRSGPFRTPNSFGNLGGTQLIDIHYPWSRSPADVSGQLRTDLDWNSRGPSPHAIPLRRQRRSELIRPRNMAGFLMDDLSGDERVLDPRATSLRERRGFRSALAILNRHLQGQCDPSNDHTHVDIHSDLDRAGRLARIDAHVAEGRARQDAIEARQRHCQHRGRYALVDFGSYFDFSS
ncbi:hypothetical protein K458DRAFT_402232 [Lentithecium fluviatile CBS 122367]|uniref:Uncharacterized protein n=1 Tax=Lentithecium fluviatile CBS 122367 TaxID=1168545 RepID=A0A6G1J7Z7_9PLEO|nr:hypothetical protein K458DRAFT_402232 [Lentithecium fluviatile CBS 122367]